MNTIPNDTICEILSHSSKLRAEVCSVSKLWYQLAINTSKLLSPVFSKYYQLTPWPQCDRCHSGGKRRKRLAALGTPTICTCIRGVPMPDKTQIAGDYHLMVRLKWPQLLKARFVHGTPHHEMFSSEHGAFANPFGYETRYDVIELAHRKQCVNCIYIFIYGVCLTLIISLRLNFM